MEEPLKDSFRRVDVNTWLIGPLILRCSSGYSDTSTWFDPFYELSFTITDAPIPPPPSAPITLDDSIIRLVYDAGDSSAVWALGSCTFCKVKVCVENTTPESTTLAFVHKQQPSFKLPTIFYQAQFNGRSYLFLSRVTGRTLADAWPTLDKKWRCHYVNTLVDICESLAAYKGSMIGGVDGQHIPESYLIANGTVENFNPQNLLEACRTMGMDCSEFVFYHADLGPGNIIVEETPTTGMVGIIDWELAGFFPRGWIRTKFRISRGLNLPESVEDPHWWRSEAQKLLGERGFEDFTQEWVNWWY
ncbi:hypothetical protein BJX68DRAFT_246745 [Aspergillus pseudodeflectus]|uniref:Aminoglycoside phosphotransferase domain-containing protein n=1 Tax=Aspergillus pseudodeflectus TaxID=176178 RepID=A0ABR4JMQ9_9EURO